MNHSGEQLRVMINTIPALAWTFGPDGATEFLNRRWLEYTGLSLQESLGWGWKAAIHPDDLEKLVNTWHKVLASGEAGEEEARLRRFDCSYRWFLFRAVPLRDGQGNIAKWYGTTSDIEDLKRAESLLSAEKQTLEMIASGANLNEVLNDLCNLLDNQFPNFISSILLMDSDGRRLRPAAGTRVPKGWAEAITSLVIGPCVGSCGTAAYLKKKGDCYRHRHRSLVGRFSRFGFVRRPSGCLVAAHYVEGQRSFWNLLPLLTGWSHAPFRRPSVT
jgi:PAS domain S-box-containing protein